MRPQPADTAGPSEFRTVVVGVTPPTAAIDVEPIGGGAFLQLTVAPGSEVVVTGYQGEPFLRFRADGVVEANERSPSLYLSRRADGMGDVPAHADAALPPSWKPVGHDGRYAWHDHRAHWMGGEPPVGAVRGQRVMDGVVPLVVDGTAVEVAVAVEWAREPSPLPLVAGFLAGAVLVALTVLARRRLVSATLLTAAAAGGLGWWQYRSLPPETGPLVVWWLLPAIAVASAFVAIVLGHRLASYALALLAAIELAIWVSVRRDGATRPVLPTDAPDWLDRGVLAAAAVVAAAATVAALLRLFRGPPLSTR